MFIGHSAVYKVRNGARLLLGHRYWAFSGLALPNSLVRPDLLKVLRSGLLAFDQLFSFFFLS